MPSPETNMPGPEDLIGLRPTPPTTNEDFLGLPPRPDSQPGTDSEAPGADAQAQALAPDVINSPADPDGPWVTGSIEPKEAAITPTTNRNFLDLPEDIPPASFGPTRGYEYEGPLLTSKEAASPFPEVSKFDRLFVGATGAIALGGVLGKRAGRAAMERFRSIPGQIKALKESIPQKIEQRAADKFHQKVEGQTKVFETMTEGAKQAKKHGRHHDVSETIEQMGGFLGAVETPRLYHWANKLGLAPSDQDLRMGEQARYMAEIEKTAVKPKRGKVPMPQFDKAVEAKAKGDWTEYQKVMLELSDDADSLQAAGATPDDLRDFGKRVDKQLRGIQPGSRDPSRLSHIEHKNELAAQKRLDLDAKLAEKARPLRYLDLDNVMELKDSIDHEMSRLESDATLLGNQKQIDFDPKRTKEEVTQKYLEKYFGAPLEDLADGQKVPVRIQEQVRSMLGMSMKALEKKRASRENYQPGKAEAATEEALPKATPAVDGAAHKKPGPHDTKEIFIELGEPEPPVALDKPEKKPAEEVWEPYDDENLAGVIKPAWHRIRGRQAVRKLQRLNERGEIYDVAAKQLEEQIENQDREPTMASLPRPVRGRQERKVIRQTQAEIERLRAHPGELPDEEVEQARANVTGLIKRPRLRDQIKSSRKALERHQTKLRRNFQERKRTDYGKKQVRPTVSV